MRNSSSEEELTDDSDLRGVSIELAVSGRDPEFFRHGATTHILNFLSDNPDINVSIRQLSKDLPLR